LRQALLREYVLGGATVFGAIVAIGTWVDGASRLIIAEGHSNTRELIKEITTKNRH